MNPVSSFGMPADLPAPALPSARKDDDPAKVRDAGRQFESLLIGQILHSARESGTGWLGTPEDSSSDCATDYAEQQFADALAGAGGIGIAHMIEHSLKPSAQGTSATAGGLGASTRFSESR